MDVKVGEHVSIAKNQSRKFETNIPRKGIVRPQSQFPHWCACERFIFIVYSHQRSAYSAAENLWTVEYINRSQTHDCGNWDWDRAIPRKGIHKRDFLCSDGWVYKETHRRPTCRYWGVKDLSLVSSYETAITSGSGLRSIWFLIEKREWKFRDMVHFKNILGLR